MPVPGGKRDNATLGSFYNSHGYVAVAIMVDRIIGNIFWPYLVLDPKRWCSSPIYIKVYVNERLRAITTDTRGRCYKSG